MLIITSKFWRQSPRNLPRSCSISVVSIRSTECKFALLWDLLLDILNNPLKSLSIETLLLDPEPFKKQLKRQDLGTLTIYWLMQKNILMETIPETSQTNFSINI